MSASETQTAANRFRFLVEAVTWRYRAQGFAVRREVRKQLLSDPVYRDWLAAGGLLPAEGLLLELGCGRGVFLALMSCSHALGMASGQKKGGRLRLMGIEQNTDMAESARLALAERADIVISDLNHAPLPSCRMAVLLDVLCYLEPEAQDQLLERVAAALEAGGHIMLRESDAGGFWRQQTLRLLATLEALLGGKRKRNIHTRSGEDWKKSLQSLGLLVEGRSMECRIGFSKVLLTARKPLCSETH